MGQYYKCVLGNKAKEIKMYGLQCENDEYNGVKLMEHSYVRNPFMRWVAKELYHNPQYLAWVGDYATDDDFELLNMGDKPALVEGNIWGDYESEEQVKARNLVAPHVNVEEFVYFSDGKAFVNHDKKEFVDVESYLLSINDCSWKISPISLMTVIGNGRGGGDYRSEHSRNLVGAWAWDLVEITDISEVPNDYKQIMPVFKED